ncbi:amidohydrolase [Magnetococcus marinus MC-1]|uniref:Amidohydrolase n=1 Tax=Magnetococcus marinus (strain ATCC BAA-1437 / JCM 17883 / MC-1) TaxID=156889 RepID=A0L8Y0_MAGMM|nr:amidohydrolase [Magnetococcus marinus]ABK44423.1 amidohydrolase [Magnetococcus marinus MC-1]
MDLYVRNAKHPDLGLVNLIIQKGIITEMRGNLSQPKEIRTTLDATGQLILPGLVNAHTHAAMTLFRGYGDDMPLMAWLEQRIWPAEAKLTEEDVYWGTKLACYEMIRSGTLHFQDMYWHFHGVAQAVEDSGIRAGVGAIFIDVAGAEQATQFKQQAQTLLEERNRYSDRVEYVLTPHAIYTVSPATLRWIANFSEQHQLPVHIHLSETQHEVESCLQQHGVRPAQHLHNQGLLTPRTFLAHCVHLDDTEWDLIAQSGATVVTNPVSNMKLAVGGVFPLHKVLARNIPVALGTDGTASNNSLDLFQEMKVLALIQKHQQMDPTAAPAQQVWEIASGKQTPLYGQHGRLEIGSRADFILLDLGDTETTPHHCLTSNLVYAATGHQVRSAVVAGRVVMYERVIEGEAEAKKQVEARAHRLCRNG